MGVSDKPCLPTHVSHLNGHGPLVPTLLRLQRLCKGSKCSLLIFCMSLFITSFALFSIFLLHVNLITIFLSLLFLCTHNRTFWSDCSAPILHYYPLQGVNLGTTWVWESPLGNHYTPGRRYRATLGGQKRKAPLLSHTEYNNVLPYNDKAHIPPWHAQTLIHLLLPFKENQ